MMIRRFGPLLATFLANLSGMALAKPSISNFEKERVPNQFIVKFAPSIDHFRALSLVKASGGKILHQFRASGAMLIEYGADAAKTATIAGQLSRDPDVEYVEANVILHMDRTPNDPRFSELYGLHNTGAQGGVVGADVGAVKAWDVSIGSRDVVVAVIDTGIDDSHPDLKANSWRNPGESGTDAEGKDKATNGLDDDENGYVDDVKGWNFIANSNDPFDDNGHGTHCAGTIGGAGDDGFGVVGVNWQVSLVAAKFLDESGSGSLDDAVKAIEYTTALGVDMTSNSWGGGGFSETMDAAIREAQDKDILFIAAAGNDTSDNDRDPHFPSSYEEDNVIAVAATDRADRIASFSSYGATSVDVGAPGVGILSTFPGGKFERLSGTSMATPHVTGVAALVKSVYPQATAGEIKARILNTSDPVAALSGKTLTGGRVNAFAALETDTIPPNAVADVTVVKAGLSKVTLSFVGSGDDGDEGAASRYVVRRAASPIGSEEDWANATPVKTQIVATGVEDRVTLEVSGLELNSHGYLAVRPVDNVGNAGPVSSSEAYATLTTKPVYENNADSLDDVTADTPWGLAEVEGRGQVFSDSPDGSYANDADTSLTLASIPVKDPAMVLTFDAAYDLEDTYDVGSVEISTDEGATWTSIATLTGESPWTTLSFELTSFLEGAKTVQVRFHLSADSTIAKEGWMVDNIKILGVDGNR